MEENPYRAPGEFDARPESQLRRRRRLFVLFASAAMAAVSAGIATMLAWNEPTKWLWGVVALSSGFLTCIEALQNCRTIIVLLPTAGFAATAVAADEVDDALAAIARVGPQGTGSVEAKRARETLAQCGPEMLPKLLAAMDTENAVAANWYRTAYDEIVVRELARPQPRFPIDELQEYAADPARQGRVRRAVFKLLDRLEPDFGRNLIPQLLDDPEFRADAVQAALDAGKKAEAANDRQTAAAEYRKAFEHSRAADQVTQAAARLTALGEPADIISHLGFVVDWYVLGPFDAPEYSGFSKVLPPEDETITDLTAEYVGQRGQAIRWQRQRATDPLGQLDLIAAIGPVKEAVGYAYSEVLAEREMDAELRCGADDNCTVWLNGQRVFGREQWLNGTRLDRFVVPVQLTKGTNRLLVKVCQGPQHKDPEVPNNWSLQVRFCDATGIGLGLTNGLPAKEEER